MAAHRTQLGAADLADELVISDQIVIPMSEIDFAAIRAQGAGGQNVNKVATAIQLRFDIRDSDALPNPVKQRLQDLNDRRISSDGIVTIKAQEHRTQARNKRAALERLREMISLALVEQKSRVPTRATKKARQQRVDDKRRRGQLKKIRKSVDEQ